MNGSITGGKNPSVVTPTGSAKPRTPIKSPLLLQHLNDIKTAERSSPIIGNSAGTNGPPPRAKSSSLADSAQRIQIQHYLHMVSGQLKKPLLQEIEHNYAKPCHMHPDSQIQSQPAKFLFMKHFPHHVCWLRDQNIDDDAEIDVVSYEETKKIPFLTPKPPPQPITVDEQLTDLDTSITDSWTSEKNKLWTRAIKILCSDRLARLSYEGHVNEVLLKRNLQERTALKFRELFGSTFWDMNQVTWLHQALMDHLDANYQTVYVDSLQILAQKIPTLIEKFFKIENKNKVPISNDPLFNTLSHYKPKKLPRKPVFILVPNVPNQNANPSPRHKYWTSLLSAMGKLIQISVPGKPGDYISDILTDIRCTVNDKIKHIKSSLTCRPVILVGFNSAAVIAAHCALQNPKSICAVVCLGFPLKTINGIRGELGDTLLELTCPIQFIIGEDSIMTSMDDIEDFRARMTRTETSLVMVGGADDRLVVSHTKKQMECLTQSMVDRCVADEIFSFLHPILVNYTEESIFLSDPRFGFRLDEHNELVPISKKPLTNRKRPQEEDQGNDLHQPHNQDDKMMSEKAPRKKSRPKPKNGLIFSQNDQHQKNLSQFLGPNFTFTFPVQASSPSTPASGRSMDLKTIIKRQPSMVAPPTPETIGGNESSPSLFRIAYQGAKLAPTNQMINGETKTTTTETKPAGAHKDSYSISEISSIHTSSTRTGRQIKPPKALDI